MRTKVGLLVCVVALLLATFSGVAAQDAVTLTVWDNFTRESEQEAIEALHAAFVAAHPDVVIVRESYETSDLTSLLPLALTESSGPDVAMVNQGAANMGALVGAGLLLPLDAYAEQYGWLDRYGAGLHQRNRVSDDGTQVGDGSLYGMSNTAEVVGVFYHKGIFEEHGLSVPTTLEEFETLSQTLIDAGVTPISFGSLDGWPAIHEFGALQNAYITPEELNALMFRFEGGTFANDADLQAAQKLVDWANAGYFPEGFEGMDYDNATTGAFINGDAAMWLTGNWVAPTVVDNADASSVGFFLLPDAAGSDVPLSIGGIGLAYGIRATSENADLAAEYIDWMTGSDAAAVLFEQGYIPAAEFDTSTLTEGTLVADIVNAWGAIAQNDKVGHYLDWTIPYDDFVASLQELLGGVTSPEDFVANVQASYEESAP